MADLARRFVGGARHAGRAVLDLLLPPQCLSCDAPVAAPGLLCAACFAATSFIVEPCCDFCGVALSAAGTHAGGRRRECASCAAAAPPWRRARAALAYDAQAKRLVLPLKYGDRVENAAALAGMMARAGGSLLRDAEVVVPVPLHRRRLLARRYNQAALLAQVVARLARRGVAVDALRRVRSTAPLGELGAATRARVVAGAFAVRADRRPVVAGRRVLLIDDVLTSGATCGGCTNALLEAGAASVDVLVAARVSNPALH